MMPWLSSVLIQTPIRSIEIGSAEATPTAVPRSFAISSSFANARSISAAVGTASIEISALARRLRRGGAARPRAGVEITEPALGGLANDGLHHSVCRHEACAHEIGDA